MQGGFLQLPARVAETSPSTEGEPAANADLDKWKVDSKWKVHGHSYERANCLRANRFRSILKKRKSTKFVWIPAEAGITY